MARAPGAAEAPPFPWSDVLPVTTHGRFAFSISVLAALNSVILGYDISVMAGANIFIKRTFDLSLAEEELETALLNLAAVPGALILGAVAESHGRRTAVFCNSVLMLLGALTMATANSFECLCLGRMVTGLAVGGGLCVVPLYIAEVVPHHVRGFLVSLCEIATSVGVVAGFFMGFACSTLPSSYSWRIMLAAGSVPAFILLVAVPYLPESPRYLFVQGRVEDARQVIRRASPNPAAEAAFFEDISQAPSLVSGGSWADVLCPVRKHRSVLAIGLAMAVAQQTTGIEAAMYYTPAIFEKAGIVDVHTQLKLTMLMGVLKLLATVIAGVWMDVFGRRVLVIVGCVAIASSQLVVALGMAAGAPLLAVLGQYLFICSYAASLGPACWVVLAELFPLRIRSKAMAVSTASNRLVSSAFALCFLSISKALSAAGTFTLLAAVNVAAGVLFYFVLPETKGKTLEELELLLTGGETKASIPYNSCDAPLDDSKRA